MSAIANFKARCEAAKRAQSLSADAPENTKAPENEALLLLAALLGCDVDQAIEQGREQVAKMLNLPHVLDCNLTAQKAKTKPRKPPSPLTNKATSPASSITLQNSKTAPPL